VSYEDAFRAGLNVYIAKNLIKKSALADEAGIRRDTFSRLLNTKRRIFGDEIMSICSAIGLNPADVIDLGKHNRSA
jgi:DNA-binding Xre family transcriptional regulator